MYLIATYTSVVFSLYLLGSQVGEKEKRENLCLGEGKSQYVDLLPKNPKEVLFNDFRYMKIHIFALLWRNEIKRSSQLRKLLKWVVEIGPEKKSRPFRDLNPDLLISRFYLFPSMMFSPKFWKSKFGILKIQIGMKKKSMFGKLVLFPSLENSQFPLKNPYNIHIKFQSGNLPIFPV